MKTFKIISLASACVAAACAFTSALAVAPLPTGWYLEGNIGNSRVTGANYVSGSSISSSGRGFNLNGGYKFIPFFAAELGYTKYADSTAKISGVKVATASYYSYDATAKALLPIGDTGGEVFAKLGIARLNANVKSANSGYYVETSGSSNATGYYFGLGADYSFMPNVAVNGQWQRAKGNSKTGNLDLYSLGISYLFG